MNFNTEFERYISLCNKWLEELKPKGDGYHKEIYDAVNYSLMAGGKRIRPVITTAVYEMLGGNAEDIKHLACAVEFIHTYSLVHDDLPCMDDDDLRRGKPTNHKVYGEALALLAGDALLNYAFETALKSDLPADNVLKCMRILGNYAGIEGMIGGQVIDIHGASGSDELIKMHEMKTAALICASAGIGALAANASDDKYESIIEFAKSLGMAFQIKDDILDVTADEAVLGKTVGSDREKGKCTYINLYGMDGSIEMLNEYTDNAMQSLEKFGEKADFLRQLSIYLLKRDK